VAFLLQGVPAARRGVYAHAIRTALDLGRPALVLVPEIALARPMLEVIQEGTAVTVLHSGLSEGDRADAWQLIRDGGARVVIGTRVALLAPLEDVGVVIVDEEHDAAYKSERTPRYQARDAALDLGRLAGAPVVLGSGTADLVSVGRARRGELVDLAGWPPERPPTCATNSLPATAACCPLRCLPRSRHSTATSGNRRSS
jgi:primosomal protein N' (replication factor Y)